jgi:hypothetical protein
MNAASNRPLFWKTILIGGFLAGSADLIFAIVYYGSRGASTMGVLQSISAGLLGKVASHQGSVPTAALGLFLHYVIACIWAAIYVAVTRIQPVLKRHAIPCGLVFGAAIFFCMNMVVLPLSAYHSKVWPPPLAAWPIAIHMLGVGLPIALVTRNISRRPR